MNTVRDAIARGDLVAARAAYDAGLYGYEPVHHAESDSRTKHGTGSYKPAHTVFPPQIARAAIWSLSCEPRWRNDVASCVAIIGSRAIPGASSDVSDVDVWHGDRVAPEAALALAAAWANEHAPGARLDLVTTRGYVPGYRPRPIVLQGIGPVMYPGRGIATDLRRLGLQALGVAPTSDPDEVADVSWSTSVATVVFSTEDAVWSALAWLERHGVPLSAVTVGRPKVQG